MNVAIFIFPIAGSLRGQGLMSTNGGSGGMYGGGGGGGRIGLHYANDSYHGTTSSIGGESGYEVGGAGTVFSHHTTTDEIVLYVNNGFRSPGPVDSRIDYNLVESEQSCRTWLLPTYDGDFEYNFDELILEGEAHLAIEGGNPSEVPVVLVNRSSGDLSGHVYVGPHQVINDSLKLS